MATITRYIQNGLDDAYTYNNGSAIVTSGFISAGDASGTRNAGMIFRDLPIPRTSAINGATITFIANANLSGTVCNTTFFGEASSNPTEFSSASDMQGRTLGSTSVNWSSIPAFTTGSTYTSPDIKTVVQEVVNRGDWAQGKSMALYWRNNASDTNARRAAYGFEDSSGSCAALTIDYTPAPVMTMRVSLPTYDCLTDGTVDHYALYADQDNVLIKEYARGTISVGTVATGTVAHNFGYPPMSMGFAKIISGTLNQYQWLYGSGYFNYYYSYSSTANVYFVNAAPFQTTTYKYYIFYDNQK